MTCRLLSLSSEAMWPELLRRLENRDNPDQTVETDVRAMLDAVRKGGDSAVLEYVRRFDCPDMRPPLRVPAEDLEQAARDIPAESLTVNAGVILLSQGVGRVAILGRNAHRRNLSLLYFRLTTNANHITVTNGRGHAVPVAFQRKISPPCSRNTDIAFDILLCGDGCAARDRADQGDLYHFGHRHEPRRDNRLLERSHGSIVHNSTFGDTKVVCHLFDCTHAGSL